MSDAHVETKIMPVTVVKGCLSCRHYDRGAFADSTSPILATCRFGGLASPLPLPKELERDGDTPPDKCPLRNAVLEVVLP